MRPIQIGVTTFAETHPLDGRRPTHGERLRQVLEEVELADSVGLDVYGVGEHHREDFASSAPAIVLAAAAGRTRRIRLASAVTVLSSADPVRVVQDFTTLDLLSSGRAEVIAGRGGFTESFPLFGYSPDDYEELFDEKLDLLVRLVRDERVTWTGRHRAPLTDQAVFPRPERPLPVWVAVGGNRESVVRAAGYRLPMVLAIIGGQPARFAPLTDLHRRVVRQAGADPAQVPIGVHAQGYVADSADRAADEYFPAYAQAMTMVGRDRGWPAMTRLTFDAMRSPQGSLLVGDPGQVADKILTLRRLLGIDRFMLHISVGTLPHHRVLRAIELLGTEVVPLVMGGLPDEHDRSNQE